MLRSTLIALGGVSGMLVLWAAVELMWRRVFPDVGRGAEAGASCGGCLVCSRRCHDDDTTDTDCKTGSAGA